MSGDDYWEPFPHPHGWALMEMLRDPNTPCGVVLRPEEYRPPSPKPAAVYHRAYRRRKRRA